MKNWRIIVTTFVLYAAVSVIINKVFLDEFDMRTVFSAIVGALFFSILLFTIGIKWMKKLGQKMAATIPEVELNNDESLRLKGPANHFRGLEGVGGMLTLTDKRLIFKSHKFNIQKHHQEFPLTEIKAAWQDQGIYNTIFKLELANGEIHKFVVDSPSDWVQKLPRPS